MEIVVVALVVAGAILTANLAFLVTTLAAMAVAHKILGAPNQIQQSDLENIF